ncbi:toxic anion resistance protein [Streptococcus marmotae]|uniref:toxic anion resistance protein n=1 Tax=Streptococcus marmotae TaxID=1825069 RepID=UPI0008343096|nr:toxic anion resistance protein [Streptococcus marmotae]
MSEFNFDLDEIASNTIKTVDKTTEIISNQLPSDRKELRFLTTLSPEQQEGIRQRTPQLVDKFVENQTMLLDFGKEAIENVNNIINQLSREQKNLQIPQVDDLFLQVHREMNGFVAKYKDAKPVELEKKPNLFQRMFKKTKNSLEEMYLTSQSIEDRLDSIAASTVKQEDDLARNIIAAERLIEENTQSIEKLVGVIAFVESSLEESNQRAVALQGEMAQLDSSSPVYHVKSEELARMTEVVNMLEQQRTEHMNRLYTAWATTPGLRNLVKTSSDIRQKFGMVRRHTIPQLKLNLVNIGFMQQSLKAGMTIDAIVNANNAAAQMLAETSKEVIPQLERSAQNPTMSIEAVTSLAESIVAQNEGIIAAIEEGRRKRQELEATILRSAEVINDSNKLRDEKIVQALLNQGLENQKEVDGASEEGMGAN